jgi:hypothetical protein
VSFFEAQDTAKHRCVVRVLDRCWQRRLVPQANKRSNTEHRLDGKSANIS